MCQVPAARRPGLTLPRLGTPPDGPAEPDTPPVERATPRWVAGLTLACGLGRSSVFLQEIQLMCAEPLGLLFRGAAAGGPGGLIGVEREIVVGQRFLGRWTGVLPVSRSRLLG